MYCMPVKNEPLPVRPVLRHTLAEAAVNFRGSMALFAGAQSAQRFNCHGDDGSRCGVGLHDQATNVRTSRCIGRSRRSAALTKLICMAICATSICSWLIS